MESPTIRIAKPPSIYIDAEIIDALIELLNNTAGKENYAIKQTKIDQVKVQTNTPDTFRKVTRSLKDKNKKEHWKNTLEIITSIYYPQEHRHIGRLT